MSVGKPYPNKNKLVVMRKGRKAMHGLLIRSPRSLSHFTMISTWSLDGLSAGTITHTVNTYIHDTEYEMVSHSSLLSDGLLRIEGLEESRRHPNYSNSHPVDFEPLLVSRYDALPLSTTGRTLWRQHTSGIYVTSREESFFALTLPLSRLTHPAMNADSRLPQPDQAIIVPG
ncbi:DUF6012 family protein [Leclercia adecarboxylata]|uniref:DUF6012 family protein n=2 Tax=Enterobacterales TaxID=91347 RepID=UPI0026DA9232|nr:DUF6012 family protein [Leclercia adecarboxylata]